MPCIEVASARGQLWVPRTPVVSRSLVLGSGRPVGRCQFRLQYREFPDPRVAISDPGYMSRKIGKFRTDKFDTCNKRKF